jgi:hypothetical protein
MKSPWLDQASQSEPHWVGECGSRVMDSLRMSAFGKAFRRKAKKGEQKFATNVRLPVIAFSCYYLINLRLGRVPNVHIFTLALTRARTCRVTARKLLRGFAPKSQDSDLDEVSTVTR